MKQFTALLLLWIFFLPVTAGKRASPLYTIDELRDPKSEHYVPYPYPYTRKEILKNLEIQVKLRLKLQTKKLKEAGADLTRITNRTPFSSKMLLLPDILAGKTSSRIGPVLKLKNKDEKKAEDFSWLIVVLDKSGGVDALVEMLADGRYPGGLVDCRFYHGSLDRLVWPKEKILKQISSLIGKTISQKHLRGMEIIDFRCQYRWEPMWEIILENGHIYYYNLITDNLFVIEKRIPWKKNKDGERIDPRLIPVNKEFIKDSVNDEVIVLAKYED